jgi:hypothetical protein
MPDPQVAVRQPPYAQAQAGHHDMTIFKVGKPAARTKAMMNRIKTLIKDDSGAVTADVVTLTGVVVTLTLVLFAAIQQELAGHLSGLQAVLSAPTTVD